MKSKLHPADKRNLDRLQNLFIAFRIRSVVFHQQTHTFSVKMISSSSNHVFIGCAHSLDLALESALDSFQRSFQPEKFMTGV